MLNNVIKMSRAAKQLFTLMIFSLVLVGCGGGGGSSDGGVAGGGNIPGSGSSGSTGAGNGQEVVSPERAATLSWNAPATRVNGEGLAMGELQGYVISYGQSADDLSETIEISDASVMDYTIENLSEGSWYFAVQVIDMNGLVSEPSSVVSKTI